MADDIKRGSARRNAKLASIPVGINQDGINKAHGGNPAFVGRNLLHIKYPDGREPNLLIVRKGFEEGAGWVDFKWPNPATKRIQDKSAYVIRTNDVVCGVGYYK